jgi:NADPH:quinone reductase-like Zn-dependent oxidoreductase
VIATTSADKAGMARELGAQEVVGSASDAPGDQMEPVDLVFDTGGGARLARASDILRTGGRVVSVATEPPPYPGRPDVDSRFFIVEPSREQLVQIANLADEGRLRPVIDEVFPLAEARRAFERISSPAHRGKVVLRVGQG